MNYSSSSSGPAITKRIETITDIPSEKLGAVIQDYTDIGGEVSYSTQPDGRFTVKAVITDPDESMIGSSSSSRKQN